MGSNSFEKLIIQARYLDDGIERLITTWKLPHVLIGRFAECTTETNSYVEAVWSDIKSKQDGINEILSEMEDCKTKNFIHMEGFLEEVKKDYESLKEHCDNLNNVLEEYGYQYNEDDILNKTNTNQNKSSDENLVQEMENLEIEFTPNLSWKCKIRQNELSSTSSNSCISHTFTTPSTNSLAISNDSSIIHKDYICTPGRERPQEPIYSKHFYNILKK